MSGAQQALKVSVVISTYKRDKDLIRALDSLVTQSFRGFEVVLVDDSAEAQWQQRVKDIAASFEGKLDLTLITNPENLGSAATRNKGIEAARGEYITFLDDDDIYLPEKIEKQLADMEAAGADYGLTDLYLYNENEEIAERRIRSYYHSDDPEELFRYHLLYHMTGTDTFMFKTDYLRKIGGFPPINVGDEFYLMKAAIEAGGKCCYSPHCYVKAYIHTGEDGGLSSGQGKIAGENSLHEEKKKYFSRLKKKDVRHIKARHYAVIAFANLRMKKYPAFFGNALKAVLISPMKSLSIIRDRRS